ARLESRSEHPIARAIVAAAPEVVGATAESAAGSPAESAPAAGSAESTPAAGTKAEASGSVPVESAELTPAAGTKAEASGSVPVESAEITDFENIAGGGLRATIDGADVLAGRPGLLREHGIDVPDDSGHRGATVVALAIDGRFRGLSFVADEAKPSAADAIAELHSLGLDTVLLTGDNAQAAEVVAERLGITEVRADVRPD